VIIPLGCQIAMALKRPQRCGHDWRSPLRLINEFPQRFVALSFQLDLPLPMSRTDRRILPMEELHVREQFPRYIDSVPGNPSSVARGTAWLCHGDRTSTLRLRPFGAVGLSRIQFIASHEGARQHRERHCA
jgi:hypothetical protein